MQDDGISYGNTEMSTVIPVNLKNAIFMPKTYHLASPKRLWGELDKKGKLPGFITVVGRGAEQ